MAPKLFLTGTTGYIGGDGLHTIAAAHPDWDMTCLVRSEAKGKLITDKYPHIKTVVGDLDSSDLLAEQAKAADIVYHFADCDHVASANAIAKGISLHTPERPGYWIHTSGTGILTWADFREKSWGEYRSIEYDDWDGIDKVTSLPDDALHRVVDKIVLATSQKHSQSVKTAIVCPPTIYGPGRGPGNQRSFQIYELAKGVLQRKKPFVVGKGENIWHQVHVQDLSDVYLALGEQAATGGDKATWNEKGYYFAENGSFVWGDIQRAVGKTAADKSLVSTADFDTLSGDEVNKVNPFGAYSWGTNSRGHAIRARKLFGWNPTRPKAIELVPSIVDLEAKGLGL